MFGKLNISVVLFFMHSFDIMPNIKEEYLRIISININAQEIFYF